MPRDADAPASRYYGSLQGAWSGPFELRVTDWAELRRSSLRASDKLAATMMATIPRLIGAATMWTTLEEGAPGEFLHTTRVTKWGASLFESRETIVLAADGRTFRMSGEQVVRPRATGVPYVADGEVDETAARATYTVPWMGTTLVQRTRIVPEGLELSQETTWSLATVLLRRAERRD